MNKLLTITISILLSICAYSQPPRDIGLPEDQILRFYYWQKIGDFKGGKPTKVNLKWSGWGEHDLTYYLNDIFIFNSANVQQGGPSQPGTIYSKINTLESKIPVNHATSRGASPRFANNVIQTEYDHRLKIFKPTSIYNFERHNNDGVPEVLRSMTRIKWEEDLIVEILVTHVSNPNRVNQYILKYNVDKFLIGYDRLQSDILIQSIEFVYDEFDNLIQKITTNQDGNTTTHDFIYTFPNNDRSKDWIIWNGVSRVVVY